MNLTSTLLVHVKKYRDTSLSCRGRVSEKSGQQEVDLLRTSPLNDHQFISRFSTKYYIISAKTAKRVGRAIARSEKGTSH